MPHLPADHAGQSYAHILAYALVVARTRHCLPPSMSFTAHARTSDLARVELAKSLPRQSHVPFGQPAPIQRGNISQSPAIPDRIDSVYHRA